MAYPVYFPNIYLESRAESVLSGFFSKITIFDLPESGGSGSAATEGKLNVEYISIDSDSGDPVRYLVDGLNSIPLYDAENATRVGSELLSIAKEEGDASGMEELAAEGLVKARIYLYMAREYDRRQLEISKDLSELKRRKESLLRELDGLEVPESSEEEEIVGPSLDYQAGERLKAWSIVFDRYSESAGLTKDAFYLTDNKEVMDLLTEFELSLEHVADISSGRISESELSEYIKRLILCRWDMDREEFKIDLSEGSDAGGATLSLYIFPGGEPKKLFRRFSRVQAESGNMPGHVVSVQNTVIGLIRI